MGFQDNSGDIILDVVLTDEGRKRLAKADGSFEIVKFGCGDDEINYGLYNLNTGSAYQDLSILQTPVLEAFTNNASSMKSMLVSIPRTNILFMPILQLNEKQVQTQVGASGSFIVAVDADTQDNSAKGLNTSVGYINDSHQQGVLFGNNPEIEVSSFIKVDAGIDGGSLIEVPADLSETQFMIQMDNRLGSLVDTTGKTFMRPVSIDDDNVATYLVSLADNNSFVKQPSQLSLDANDSPINGPLSSTLEFKIKSSPDLVNSNYLFNLIGSTANITNNAAGFSSCKIIDSYVRITGRNIGYSIDIPVRYAKL
tara:strand:+ start:10789 stop:11721 length:933 start_codon:yes stop_codon:yes gene_type:complete